MSKLKIFCLMFCLAATSIATGTSAKTLVPARSLTINGTIIYVSKLGKDVNAGTDPASAVATVARGIALAAAAGGGEVRVTKGSFEEASIDLPGGVTVSGGWGPSFIEANRKLFTGTSLSLIKAADNLCVDYTCVTTKQGDRVFSMKKDGTTAARGLTQLVVIGPDRSGVVGSNSYGVVVDEVPATLDFVVIKAGKGGTGAAGTPGTTGVGHSTNGGPGGHVSAGSDGWTAWCNNGDGTAGDSVIVAGLTVAKGGGGGGRGATNCGIGGAKNEDADNGNSGQIGDDGLQGSHGVAAAADPGFFSRLDGTLQWASNSGGQGGSGSAGGGGGGGGAGGSFTYVYWCLVSSTGVGGNGAMGGRGGSPGGGGTGGHAGGGTFGLVINNSIVTAAGLALFGGEGGKGGDGGKGGQGAPGEAGSTAVQRGNAASACGGPTRYGGYGASGGAGGAGGAGAGGAAGNGGAAINIALLGNGELKLSGNLHNSGGRAGVGGTGGQGGKDQNRAASGNSGKQHDQLKLELK